ncbi:MAG: ABC transporter ATP-binding protein [Amnibacterium sp.]
MTPAADGAPTDGGPEQRAAAPGEAPARAAAKRPAKPRTGTARPKATTGEPGAMRSTARSGTRKPATRAAESAAEPARTRAPAKAAAPEAAEDGRTLEIAPEGTTELLPVAGDDPTTVLPAVDPLPAASDDDATVLLPAAEAPGRAPVAEPVDAAPEPVREPVAEAPAPPAAPSRLAGRPVLRIEGLAKRFGPTIAVAGIDLVVEPGSDYGIVGPTGAGKTTTRSMITGLLRPDTGVVHVHGIDVWREPERAKRAIGVLPDALRLFDRLSGAQLLHYSGVLRGLDAATVKRRTADLVQAFGLEDATGRLVADYSAGMTKKIALACAMIHSPRLLVLDEPFESVDPVSAANIVEILQRYVRAGGTVVLSSHGMDLIQRVCDHVAIIIGGKVLAAGTVDEVRGEQSLEDRFVDLAGGRKAAEGLEWLHSFSD